MKILFTSLLVLAYSASAFADSYAVGLSIDGYTKQSDGYWWRGQAAYSLKRIPVYQGYTNCVAYYKNQWIPQAVIYKEKVIEKPVYQALEKVTYTDKDWREKILDIAEKRDEQKAFLEAVNALGFSEIQQTKKYQAQNNNSYGYRLNQSRYNYAPQGNTVYGYSVGSLAQVYGDNDVSLWMQQASRAQNAAQITAEKGLGGMLQAIELEGSNRARVATILAKAQLLKSLDAEETVTNTQVEVSGHSTGSPVFQAQAQAGLQGIFQQRCYSCHSGNKTDGGVDLTLWDQFQPQQQKQVWDQVSTGKMPKGGPALNLQEMSIVLGAIVRPKQYAKP